MVLLQMCYAHNNNHIKTLVMHIILPNHHVVWDQWINIEDPFFIHQKKDEEQEEKKKKLMSGEN